MKTWGAFAIGVSLTTLACGPADRNGEELGSERVPITGGTLVPSSQHGPPDTSAIRIRWFDSGGIPHGGTGIKVASNVYWTAAHVIESAGVGRTVHITNNLSGTFSGGYTSTIQTLDVHASRKNFINTLLHEVFPDHYDVARFTLNDTTPNIPSFSTTDAAWVGENQSVTFTGYGCDTLDPSHDGKKQYAFFSLASSSTLQNFGLKPSYYLHNMGSIGESPQGCSGDSGAPLFKKFGSTYKQVGIVVHGGDGYTGFVRYSNIRNWLASPAFNLFEIGFRGFIFNRFTGRCLTPSGGPAFEDPCKGTDQNWDMQSWGLAESGWTSDTFLLVNGAQPQQCLDADTTVNPPQVVQRTCSNRGLFNTQRWRFDSTNHSDYRRLVNHALNLCALPSDPLSAFGGGPGSMVILGPCSTAGVTWEYQAWMMTR